MCCVVVCDLETSRMGAPYIYNISRLRVKLALDEVQAPAILSLQSLTRRLDEPWSLFGRFREE